MTALLYNLFAYAVSAFVGGIAGACTTMLTLWADIPNPAAQITVIPDGWPDSADERPNATGHHRPVHEQHPARQRTE